MGGSSSVRRETPEVVEAIPMAQPVVHNGLTAQHTSPVIVAAQPVAAPAQPVAAQPVQSRVANAANSMQHNANTATTNSIEWICVPTNRPYPFREQKRIEKAYQRYIRRSMDAPSSAHCEIIGEDDNHYMILFKDNNVFTEMNVLTATERAVQRREVIYNTTGIASVAQREPLAQRNAREAMELLAARDILAAEQLADRRAYELAMQQQEALLQERILKSLNDQTDLERAIQASLATASGDELQRAIREQIRKLSSEQTGSRVAQNSLATASDDELQRAIRASMVDATQQQLHRVNEEHARKVLEDKQFEQARRTSVLKAAGDHLVQSPRVSPTMQDQTSVLFDMVKAKVDPQEIFQHTRRVLPGSLSPIVEIKDMENNSLVMIAALSHHTAFVQAFGPYVDMGARNRKGHTCLHLACSRTSANACPTIRELLALRAPLEASNSIGDTPLHCAVKAGSSPVVAMLVECGADINAPNHREETPMTVATSRGLGALAEVMRATSRHRLENRS